MKLTNQDMDLYVQSLSKISTKVTGKLAYAVAKNIRKLTSELVEYEHSKNANIEKFGEKNEQGNYFIRIDSEGFKKYIEAMEGIQYIECNVDIVKVPAEVVEKSELNAQEMLSIDFMITEDTDE